MANARHRTCCRVTGVLDRGRALALAVSVATAAELRVGGRGAARVGQRVLLAPDALHTHLDVDALVILLDVPLQQVLHGVRHLRYSTAQKGIVARSIPVGLDPEKEI